MSSLEAYLAGPGLLRASVEGLDRKSLVSRPIPGTWSLLEIVCHLADADANIAHRIKRVLSEDRPTFERVQPERMIAALAYQDRDVEDELATFEANRRQVARILLHTPPEAWSRTGVVGDRGDRTVTQMVNGAVEHLAHHLKFLVEKRRILEGAERRPTSPPRTTPSSATSDGPA